ncbi:MAG: hypothetical protein ACUVUU_04985 [bacterium]
MTTAKILSRVYKRFIWSIYDNIGRVILINLFWFLLLPLPAYLIFKFIPVVSFNLRILLATLYTLAINPYATGGVFVFTAKTVRRMPSSLADFFRLPLKLYLRILAVTLIYTIVIALLIYGIRFYSSSSGLGIIGKGLAIWQVTILLLVFMLGQYSLPLIVLRDIGVKRCFKFSGLLMMLRPSYSVLILIQTVALALILVVTGIGLAVLAMVTIATFLNSATEISIREIERSTQTPTKPTSWKEIFTQANEDEDRSLNELFHPWNLK